MQATFDLHALARIRSLELRAKSIVEGLWRGMHRSPYHGFSVEFSEYRAYVQGDDPRYLDWKVMARSDRCFIKKYEDETNLRCHLILDHSLSMQFGLGAFSKTGYAATLAATLALFLMRQGDAVGLSTFGERLLEHIPPRNRPGHLRRILVELEKASPPGNTALDGSLRQVAELAQKRGLICILSDFLTPLTRLESPLGTLRAMGHEVVLFHLLDRQELDFSFENSGLFEDMENHSERLIRPELVRGRYLANLKAHLANLTATSQKLGMEYHLIPTDTALEKVLFDFLSKRQRKSGGRALS